MEECKLMSGEMRVTYDDGEAGVVDGEGVGVGVEVEVVEVLGGVGEEVVVGGSEEDGRESVGREVGRERLGREGVGVAKERDMVRMESEERAHM